MPPRTCPNCRKQIPLDDGFHFDSQNNLVCENCGKVAFAVEKVIDKNPEVIGTPAYRPILPVPEDQL